MGALQSPDRSGRLISPTCLGLFLADDCRRWYMRFYRDMAFGQSNSVRAKPFRRHRKSIEARVGDVRKARFRRKTRNAPSSSNTRPFSTLDSANIAVSHCAAIRYSRNSPPVPRRALFFVNAAAHCSASERIEPLLCMLRNSCDANKIGCHEAKRLPFFESLARHLLLVRARRCPGACFPRTIVCADSLEGRKLRFHWLDD